jgi:tetratricopeptide (TPR) repeat protein
VLGKSSREEFLTPAARPRERRSRNLGFSALRALGTLPNEAADGGVQMRHKVLFAFLSMLLPATVAGAQAQVEDCKSKDPDIAISGCTKVLQRSGLSAKDRAAAHGHRGMSYAKKGLMDEALFDGFRAIEADPKNAVGYLWRAYIYLRKPDNDRAMADAMWALQLDPKSAEAYHLRGIVLSRRGELDAAIADYDRAIQLNPKGTAYLSDRGAAYFGKGEFDKAIADLTHAIANNPGRGEVYAYRGAAYGSLGEYERALADLSQAIAIEPKNFRAYAYRARVYIERGETERALADIEHALALNPNAPEIYLARGTAFANQGAFDRALKDYNRVLEIDPKRASAYSSRCSIYLTKDESERALADCNRAIELNPRYSAAYVGRGTFHAIRKDYAKALADYTRAIELVAKNYAALSQRGRAYLEMGELEKGRADIERAIEVHPKYARAYLHRGMMHMRRGDKDRAIADLSKAIQIDARLAEAHAVRADAYIAAGQPIPAIADLRAVLRLPARNLPEKEAQIRAAELLTSLAPKPANTPIPILAPGASPTPSPPAGPPGAGGKRVAMLIGNSAYGQVGELKNPGNDVRILSQALRRIGFRDVTEHFNLGLAAMTAALKTFGDRSSTADWAVIYFSGHGLEMGGVSYLLPVDAKLERDAHVTDETVPLERMLQKTEGARSLRLVILDACRNNPFATRMARTGSAVRSVGRGLAAIEPEGDVLVAYATKHGTTALDGEGDNSPYALALLQHLPMPNIDIRVMFGRVRDTVRKTTNNQQEPYTYGSIGGDLHYFVAAVR